MATNIEIKAAIDTDITNKTLPSSVTNTNVGARIKDIVDYVDQETVNIQPRIKTQKTIITSSQILNWQTIPVKIVNGEAGKIKHLLSYIVSYTYGTTAYTLTGSGTLGLKYGSYSIGLNINQPFVNTTSSQKFQYYFLSNMPNISFYSGEEDINVQLTSGNYNAGDGTLTIYATYIETIL